MILIHDKNLLLTVDKQTWYTQIFMGQSSSAPKKEYF